MFELKRITADAIPRTLAKAERYRLLNEPEEAESISEDVLEIDPENQQALVMLLLAFTDGFRSRDARSLQQARALLPRLKAAYDQAYYSGIICERWAKAQYNPHRSSPFVEAFLREAMNLYEEAMSISPPGNDDAVLRWNACVRFFQNKPELKSEGDLGFPAGFGDDSPPR
jgi:tetratricopeptide (TPR) repeat protein